MKIKDNSHPPWLKAMQNGALGEARARAFLLDRFWVLERSVDIQGADLIIQRRITGKNLLDREAPRLGFVQVKFFGTKNTSHFVHKEYVVDDAGNPREEFFLMCHAGNEDDSRLYVVFARELHETFPLIAADGNESYRVSYNQLLTNERFEVTCAARTLDRIEWQLENAEFTKNRRFLSWALPSVNTELGAIKPVYREPIDNWWGDIPQGFERIKKTAHSAMLDVEEIYNLLLEITKETDPVAAELIIDRLKYHCRDGYGRWRISLPDDLDDSDFFNVCRRHKRIIERLRADGFLDAFLRMKDILREKVIGFLEGHLPLDPNVLHRFSLIYDPDDLTIKTIQSTLWDVATYLGLPPKLDRLGQVEVDISRWKMIEKAVPGRIDYYWLPGRQISNKADTETLIERYRGTDFQFYFDCLDAVFTLKYGDLSSE